MKPITLFLVALLFAVADAKAVSPREGFHGELEVHSVSFSSNKVVFVVSGPVHMLLTDPLTKFSEGRSADSTADHVVIILYRTYEEYPANDAWQKACEQFKHFSGGKAVFDAVAPQYTLDHGDFTLVTTKRLLVSAP